ncbi:uncharacterized protein LOC106650244 isoform X1 [Trichogramma pretiosum]|uniref:uncharacterized protein LOC106650244 isoform X1 n=1 Tax=Trichogramma pretiosum TaxID=7493 RepID=UPI0006C93F03|nr:uncharacterized protein LOC106650244 isoform X1 [Trichogramma pretiosum]
MEEMQVDTSASSENADLIEKIGEQESEEKAEDGGCIGGTTSVETQVNCSPGPDPVVSLHKRVESIVSLMNELNDQLEILSNERRTSTLKTQWSIIEEFKTVKSQSGKPSKIWHNSLFFRMYFVEKELDDIFLAALRHNSMLCKHLNNLNDKIVGKNESKAASYVQQQPQHRDEASLELLLPTSRTQELLEAAMKSHQLQAPQCKPVSAVTNSKEDESSGKRDFKQSFTDLIRAKIDFDSQFIQFNALMSENCHTEDFQSFYKLYCAANSSSKSKTSSSSLAIDKSGGDTNQLRRKRLSTSSNSSSISHRKKTQKQRTLRALRRSSRLASDEVQIIRTVKRAT